MERPQEDFRRLVEGYLSSRGGAHAPVTQAGCFIETAGVRLQLLLEPARRQLAIAATIFDGVGDPRYLVHEIISDFNAVNMFHGGYCLLVEDTFGGLYVNRYLSLDSLDPPALSDALDELARRTMEWRRWYREAAEDFWPSPVPEDDGLAGRAGTGREGAAR